MTRQKILKATFATGNDGDLLSSASVYSASAFSVGSPEIQGGGVNAPAGGNHRAYFLTASEGKLEEDEPRAAGNIFGDSAVTADQYAQIEVAAIVSFGPAPICRCQSDGTGYMLFRTTLATERRLARWTSGGTTVVISTVGSLPSLGVGDVLRLETDGTTLRGYRNDVLEIEATDATLVYGGAGLYVANDSGGPQGDNFEAGLLTSCLPVNEEAEIDAALVSVRRSRNRGVRILSGR